MILLTCKRWYVHTTYPLLDLLMQLPASFLSHLGVFVSELPVVKDNCINIIITCVPILKTSSIYLFSPMSSNSDFRSSAS